MFFIYILYYKSIEILCNVLEINQCYYYYSEIIFKGARVNTKLYSKKYL